FAGALGEAYPTWDALKRLMSLGLDVEIDRITQPAGTDTVVVVLLEWAVSNQRLVDLVKAAVTLNARHDGLRQFAREMGWEPLPDDHQVKVANVKIALKLLTLDPNVRDALAGFQAVFESADRRL